MTYEEIIQENCRNHSSVKWWPLHAFHYTDVENAVSILTTGYLYSRVKADRLSLMKNDNASRQVINMTSPGVTASVRFYFRPLTPTQYHNEGYKHPEARFQGDTNANVPVPVFFVFDLAKVLNSDKTYFSEMSQAGAGSRLCNTPEDFSRFNFDEIYKNGYMDNPDIEKKFRQAEILYMDSFPIDYGLQTIYCRNAIERMTLLNLLRAKDTKKFLYYKDKVRICRRDMFENNGLFVTDCRYYDGRASIAYSDTYEKRCYLNRYRNVPELRKLEAKAEFDWVRSGKLLNRQYSVFSVNYENAKMTTFTGLKEEKGASALYMRLYIEDKLMCFMSQQLSEAALF